MNTKPLSFSEIELRFLHTLNELTLALTSHVALWVVVGTAIPAFLLIGWRMRRFHRPEWPLMSPVLAKVGIVATAAGLVSIGAAAVLALLILAFAWLAGVALADVWRVYQPALFAMGMGCSASTLGSGLIVTVLIPLWERAGKGLSGISAEDDRAAKYHPERYFRRDKFFLGLQQSGKPLYLPWDSTHQHMQIVGPTDVGKGTAAQVLLPQFAQAGETVIVFDPKNDSKLPAALCAFAQKHGLPFHVLDLRPSAPPQFNLLEGLERRQLEELLNAGFGSGDSGEIDRVYRLADRQAAKAAALLAAERQAFSLPGLVSVCIGDEAITSAKMFWGNLNELADIPAIQTKAGLSLASCLDEGGFVYIIGSTLDEATLMLQKMVLLRILQIIYSRPRGESRRVALFLDEFKYLLSTQSVNALGIVRDFGCHVLLAHQSLGDLEACGGISPEVVKGAVLDNTNLKLIYRPISADVAEWAEAMTGTTPTFTETVSRTSTEPGRSENWREVEVPFIHRNRLLQLPRRTGLLLGAGLPTVVTMDHLRKLAELPPISEAPHFKPSDDRSGVI